jgi:hypothetical protein
VLVGQPHDGLDLFRGLRRNCGGSDVGSLVEGKVIEVGIAVLVRGENPFVTDNRANIIQCPVECTCTDAGRMD